MTEKQSSLPDDDPRKEMPRTGGAVPSQAPVPRSVDIAQGSSGSPSTLSATPVATHDKTPNEVERDRIIAFAERLYTLTPRVWGTIALLIGVVGWYGYMVVRGVDAFDPTGKALVEYGANFGPFTISGEWGRLFSAMFVHVGLMHLAFNTWALYVVGPLLERMLGHVGFLLLYFIAGAAGSIASVIVEPRVVSAGASGAIFGAVGGLLGFLLLSRHSVPASAFRRLRNTLGLFVVLNIALGFMIPQIDNAAHIGGLVTGFVCGLLLGQPLDERTPQRRIWHNLALFVVGGSAVTLAIAYLPELSRAFFRQ